MPPFPFVQTISWIAKLARLFKASWWQRSEADVWWRKDKKETTPDWRQEGFEKMLSFRRRGETFCYLGITMMVTGHWKIIFSPYGVNREPSLHCDYVDKNGVLHTCSFSVDELPTLEMENNKRRV